jgi:hypothetical protein
MDLDNVLTPASTRGLRLTLAATIGAAVLATAAPVSATTSAVPYSDPAATGVIGLCDKAGQPVTHGTITAKPFVFRAVSSAAAAAPYSGSGRTASLYAYQPRQDVPAGDWSGQALTASTRYTNPAHPMAQATKGDDSLADFMANYSPAWNGLLELRMFLGAPDATPESFTYPATDIQVTGDTWHVVRGGNVPCTSGHAQSIESILLSSAQIDPKHHHGRHHVGSADAKQTGGHRPGATPASSGAIGTAADSASQTPASGGDNHDAIVGVLIAFFVLLVGSVAIAARRKPDPAAVTQGTTKESK